MNIITISREFGSGGRELGKCLADYLGCDYYDREIITAIAKSNQLDESYVENVLKKKSWHTVPLTYGKTFFYPHFAQDIQIKLLTEQTKIIEHIASQGKSCVIVGRNADYTLRSYKPFNIFVCAQMEAKIQRCLERAEKGELLSRKEIERQIHRIDKARANTHEIISNSSWGDSREYHLTINTTDWGIKSIIPHIADLALNWFERS